MPRRVLTAAIALVLVALVAPVADATPVCTDGHGGGPDRSLCGGRIFPEAERAIEYVQYTSDPVTGFREYQHGLEYLEILHPRWISVFSLREYFGTDEAVSVGEDGIRAHEAGDTGDGLDIWVVKLTDHQVPDDGKMTLFFSLSVHGDEKGGLEGGLRAIEDLANAATDGGTIVDGVSGYPSATGFQPSFHEYEVADVLAKEAVYFTTFNIDGFREGDYLALAEATGTGLYTRGNALGTDLNRQMPTIGRIDSSRNPLEEREIFHGLGLMQDVADAGVGGLMAYGADIHGETQSRAFADIMYPAGQFDSIKHRQLMAIAERTKSVIDRDLYDGYINFIEEQTGGDTGEGIEDLGFPVENTFPTKPARWGTVWDTLGYTDTGFIGDYMASELGVTGMDYEIALNHADFRAIGRPWAVLLQELYISVSRAIVKTAMAYALTQELEFADFSIDPGGRVGYVHNPEVVTDADENGPGTLPGPNADGIGANGLPVEQQPYAASNMKWFVDTAEYVDGGIHAAAAADIAADAAFLDQFDTLVLADIRAPQDAHGRSYDEGDYFANLRSWVERGGNLVLVDRALHVLADLGLLGAGDLLDIGVYMPYANFVDLDHDMTEGLRGNARQLSEATLIGYDIGNDASPMTAVATGAWEAIGGHVVGTTGPGSGGADDGSLTTVGQVSVGDGIIRIMGGGLHQPTEEHDHRYGLKDYSLTYSGLYVLENSIVWDAANLGQVDPVDGVGGGNGGDTPTTGAGMPAALAFAALVLATGMMRRRAAR